MQVCAWTGLAVVEEQCQSPRICAAHLAKSRWYSACSGESLPFVCCTAPDCISLFEIGRAKHAVGPTTSANPSDLKQNVAANEPSRLEREETQRHKGGVRHAVRVIIIRAYYSKEAFTSILN